MEQKELIWIKEHQIHSWYPGQIIQKSDDIIIAIDDSGKQFKIKKNQANYVKQQNLRIVDDLLELPDFHEGLLLHNIRNRYQQNYIYTSIGSPILIAVNPYQNLDIYTDEIKNIYRHTNQLNKTSPHLYKVGEIAFRNLKKTNQPQSIIITGESGSGKTESTKVLLNYMADKNKQKNNLENKIVYVNMVLESFGNAKTVKNDNSSRFGKFIELEFDEHIKSAYIQNYLLEKSRIIFQNKNERNYHIFYQLFFCDDQEIYELTKLNKKKKFRYLNFNYENFEQQKKIDKEDFQKVLQKMKGLGFHHEVIQNIFKIISGILYLGEIIIEGDENESQIDMDDQNLIISSQLLGIDKQILSSLCINKIFVNPMTKEEIIKNLDLQTAQQNRNTLSKIIYNSLFDWILKGINKAIIGEQGTLTNGSKSTIQEIQNEIVQKQLKKKESFFQSEIKKEKSIQNSIILDEQNIQGQIGILDIYGFEIFEQNSFEQFCINYTNEKLQEQFNQNMFSIEQKLYQQEGIDWQNINFPDNKDIVQLIEGIPISVFSILDEMSTYKDSTDQKLLQKLRNKLKNKNQFIERNLKKRDKEMFGINHFAGTVYYTIDNFIDKNKNSINSQIYQKISNSQNLVLSEIFQEQYQQKMLSMKAITTVSNQFQKQLKNLIIKLNNSLPLYIRCIKPNDIKQKSVFESISVNNQLKAAGMLEAIKIRKAGYPIRRTYDQFYDNYRNMFILYKIKDVRQLFKYLFDQQLLNEVYDQQNKSIVFGKTIIFMKEELKNELDRLQEKILYQFAQKIQRLFRKFIFRKRLKYLSKVFKIILTKFSVFKNFNYLYDNIQNKKQAMKKIIHSINKIQDIQIQKKIIKDLKQHNQRQQKKEQLQQVNKKITSKSISQNSFYSKENQIQNSDQLQNNEVDDPIKEIINSKKQNNEEVIRNLTFSKVIHENQEQFKYQNDSEQIIEQDEDDFFPSKIHKSIRLLDSLIQQDNIGNIETSQEFVTNDFAQIQEINCLKSENIMLKQNLQEVENKLHEKEKDFQDREKVYKSQIRNYKNLNKSLEENLQLFQFECSNYKEKYVQTKKQLQRFQDNYNMNTLEQDLEQRLQQITSIINNKNQELQDQKIKYIQLQDKYNNVMKLQKESTKILTEREFTVDKLFREMKQIRQNEQLTISNFNEQNSLLFKQNTLCKDIINALINLLKWKTVEKKLEKEIEKNVNPNNSKVLNESLKNLISEEHILKQEIDIKVKRLKELENDQLELKNLENSIINNDTNKKTLESEIFFEQLI